MKYYGPEEHDISDIQPVFRVGYPFYRDDCTIIAIDPGGTTGWSKINLRKEITKDGVRESIWKQNLDTILSDKGKLWWKHGQIDARGPRENLAIYQLCEMIDETPGAAVVLEDFILRIDRREKSRDLLSPVRINAAIMQHLWRQNRRVILQQPALAKTTATDDRLKLWGVYVREGGLQHARDADRHIITFIRRCMNPTDENVRRAAWPHHYK